MRLLFMKRMLFLLFFFAPALLPAQTKKGDQTISLLGWGRATRFVTFDPQWSVSTTASLHYQYFLSRNFSAGLRLEYRATRPSSYNAIFVMPEARYYFLDGALRPFVYASAGTGWYKYSFGNEQYRKLPFITDFGAGASWSITPRWAIEGQAGINTYWNNGRGSSSLAFKIGVKYTIPRKEKK